MVLYYRDDTVEVTSSWVRVGGDAYRIAELTYVWHRRSRRSLRVGGRLLGRWMLVSLLTAPLGFGALCAVSALFADWGQRLGAALVGLAAAVAVAIALAPLLEFPLMALERSYDRGGAVHELWVQVRGAERALLRTTDAQRFGQIYRALQRAIENTSP